MHYPHVKGLPGVGPVDTLTRVAVAELSGDEEELKQRFKQCSVVIR